MVEPIEVLSKVFATVEALGTAIRSAAPTLALLASAFSVVVAIAALRVQRRFNVISVTPLPEVAVEDYENRIRVSVRNNGTGPLIFKKLEVSNGEDVKPSVIRWMSALPGGRRWNDFSERFEERSLRPGGEIVLLELSKREGERDFLAARDQTREELGVLTVKIHFSDIYATAFQPYTRKLDWFARHKEEGA